MKSLFIVLEGLDGSGTSTQAQMLKDYFTAKNKSAILSPEPTDGPIGNFIRTLLNNQVNLHHNSQEFDRQMSYLFAADRYHHLYNQDQGVIKTLASNINVISTRYYFSSFAYHGHNLEDWLLVKKLNEDFPVPDLVVYLDIPVAISIKRLQGRSQLEVYENEEKLKEVKNNYYKIFQQYTGLLLTVDATNIEQEVHQKITDFITDNFKA